MRKMVQEQAMIPLVDGITIDSEGKVIETLSLSLFPIVPLEDFERFFKYINLLTQLYREIEAFSREGGLA